ncbi:MAG TPA: zf-HC2 domain-containing protein [Gemmatimonadaceae bacterium]|nr:zf-HC2 domain-containing protein [Gemmatimonadaceae bacterium]
MAVSLVMNADPEHLLRHAIPRDALPTAECLDEDMVAALADGTLDDVARTAVLPHLAECPRCRGAVASVTRALRDPSVARELETRRDTRRRLFLIGIPAAAAAIVLLIAMPRPNDDVTSHRAPTITAVSSPVPMAPVGIVAGADILRWSSVSGADRYRTTLFDATGAVVYETQTADTAVSLPDSVRLTPSQSYLWKVEARTGWGRWSASELIEFTIR